MIFKKENFSLLALRVLPECEEHLKKTLKDEWYLFNNWYHVKNGHVIRRKDASFERCLYGENVSISAIVGKNGSGKSSLMELVFRIVNNLSFCMMHGITSTAAWPPVFIEGLFAELYFESQGEQGCVSCKGFKVRFRWGDDAEISYVANQLIREHDNKSRKTLAYITRHFCFCLVSNYALMSLNPSDYWQDVAHPIGEKTKANWLDSIYNKNDGYTAAIGIEPYKGEGNINLYTQRKLCKARLVGMLIETGRNGADFFDGYSYNSIELNFDWEFMYKQANDAGVDFKHGGKHLNNELPGVLKNKQTFAAVILDSYGMADLQMGNQIVVMAATYLVFKTLHVAETYTKYEKHKRVGKTRYFARSTEAFDKHKNEERLTRGADSEDMVFSEFELRTLVADIKEDHSHITLKIRQTIHFLNMVKEIMKKGRNLQCLNVKNYEDYMKLYDVRTNAEYARIFDNTDSIMDYFPLPFFETAIYLNKTKNTKNNRKEKVAYGSLSTGEQQFMQTAVSLIYHIRNIVSVEDIGAAAKYYNINLFIDEVEACFHPEYQQRFVKLFLGMIKGQRLTDKCNINIIIATHSPFILSDIPRQNIVYLDSGRVANKQLSINPFCGNVCDMLRHSFFLESGFMGDWAKDMVNDLIAYLSNPTKQTGKNQKQSLLYDWDEKNAKAFINMIGEPILKGSLMNKYAEAFGEQNDALLAWHQAEIDRLTKNR